MVSAQQGFHGSKNSFSRIKSQHTLALLVSERLLIGRKMKILIVEDDPLRIEMFNDILADGENIIYHTDKVESAHSALQVEGDIGMILLDQNLGHPNLTGEVLTDKIVEDSENGEEYISNLKAAIVHTNDTVSGVAMTKKLKKLISASYYVPFFSLVESDTLSHLAKLAKER